MRTPQPKTIESLAKRIADNEENIKTLRTVQVPREMLPLLRTIDTIIHNQNDLMEMLERVMKNQNMIAGWVRAQQGPGWQEHQ